MYSLTRGPSKLASKASQRGLTQQIEKFEGRVEPTNRPFANGSTPMIMTRAAALLWNPSISAHVDLGPSISAHVDLGPTV
ncbi:hypothetical protein LSAT2_014668 [Lamellibrachia satsuma]|nr:hypothetical protein LSAT2_014668 [Lamellibrachia satsuma]